MGRAETIFCCPHLGLGDAIVCCGMVRALNEQGQPLIWPVKEHNYGSVQEMFMGLFNVMVLSVKDDQDMIRKSKLFDHQLKLGVHSGQPLRSDWDRQIYEQAGVAFEARWGKFRAPPVVPYIWESLPSFLHDDADRGFVITKQRPKDYMRTWYAGTIWTHLLWLMKAPEIHVIDSCFLCLADSVPTRARRLVFHKYARPGGMPPTLRKNWEVLT